MFSLHLNLQLLQNLVESIFFFFIFLQVPLYFYLQHVCPSVEASAEELLRLQRASSQRIFLLSGFIASYSLSFSFECTLGITPVVSFFFPSLVLIFCILPMLSFAVDEMWRFFLGLLMNCHVQNHIYLTLWCLTRSVLMLNFINLTCDIGFAWSCASATGSLVSLAPLMKST